MFELFDFVISILLLIAILCAICFNLLILFYIINYAVLSIMTGIKKFYDLNKKFQNKIKSIARFPPSGLQLSNMMMQSLD